MQQFDVSFAIRRGAPVPSGGCEEVSLGSDSSKRGGDVQGKS